MSPHSAEILLQFDRLNAKLFAKGFPDISPWWRETIRRWYGMMRRQLVARVGRRGGKSSSLCRLAVVEALYGQHKIPPGDVGVIPIVSARREDATERLRTIKAILDAIGVGYDEKGDTVELRGRPIKFTVFTASIAGVSGFTGIFILLDEVAKWRDSDTGSNPAAIVIKSIRPTMATQPNARIVLSSSPMGLLDAHADAYAKGDTSLQTTAYAETWVANPTVSETETHILEPDETDWEREYKAIPQAEAETSVLTDVMVTALTRPGGDTPPDDRHTYVATIDPATRGNAWTLTVGCLSDNRMRRVALTREWRGSKAKPLKAGAIFREIAEILRPYRLAHVHSDQWSEDTLRELATPAGLFLLVTPWTAGLKADAYDDLKTIAKEGRLDLPKTTQTDSGVVDGLVKTDLLGIRTKLTRNGVVYDLATQGGRHSDFAPCIAMNLALCRVPPTPLPVSLTADEEAEADKRKFLEDLTRERKRAERRGPLPVTHTYRNVLNVAGRRR